MFSFLLWIFNLLTMFTFSWLNYLALLQTILSRAMFFKKINLFQSKCIADNSTSAVTLTQHSFSRTSSTPASPSSHLQRSSRLLPSLRTLLSMNHDIVFDLFAHQHYPFKGFGLPMSSHASSIWFVHVSKVYTCS